MGDNGIASVYDTGIVPSLIKHSHIQSQNVCNINSAGHTALVGADNHHMIGINIQVGNML